MLSLREVVSELTQSQALFKTLRNQFTLQDFWTNEFESGITAQARVNRLEAGQLFFEVQSAPWAAQLRFYAAKILEKFKTQWPEIQSVKFQVSQNPWESTVVQIATPVQLEKIEGSMLERLEFKSRQLREKRLALGWKICGLCQSLFLDLGSSKCLLCRQTENLNQTRGMTQQIMEAPWAREAQDSDEYSALRQKLRNQTRDQIQSLFWQYQKEPSAALKVRMASLMQQFASLQTGLTPDKLNDRIISEAIGKSFYQRWLKILKANHTQ